MGQSIYSHDLSPKPDPLQRKQGYAYLEQLRRQPPAQWSDDRYAQSQHFRDVIYVAVSAVMDLIGSADFGVVRRRRKSRGKTTFGKSVARTQSRGADEDYTPFDDLDHPLAHVVSRPNGNETFGELAAKLVLQNRLTGVGPLWAVPNPEGKPVELWALKTALMSPQYWQLSEKYPDGAWRITPFYGSGWMGVTPSGMGAGGAILPGREVKRFMSPHPLIDFDGYSPLTAGGTQLDVLESIDESRKTAMDHGLQLDAVLVIPGLSDDEVKATAKTMTKESGGSKNARKVAVFSPQMGAGDKATLSLLGGTSARDMDYSNGWEQMVKFALALFGVPAPVAGLATPGSYAEFFAAIKQFSFRQGSFAKRLEDWLTKVLAWPWCSFTDEFQVKVKLPEMDDPDLLEKQLAADVGIRSVNERRAVRDLEPVEHGEWPEQIFLKVLEQEAMPQQSAPGAAPGVGQGGADPLAALLGGGGSPEEGNVPQPENPEGKDSLPPTVKKAAADGQGKTEGQVWQGESGKWFTLKGGHVVPHAAPGGAGDATPPAASNHAAVSGAAEKLAAGGAGMTHEDVASLNEYAATLGKGKLKGLADAIRSNIGEDKAAMADRIIAWAKSQATAAEPAASPAAGVGGKLDAAAKALGAEIERGMTEPADVAAKADALLADLEKNHTPDEIREIARRVTGKKGQTAGQALANIRADLTAVHRQLESQKV